jgi:hypothetical protein
LEHYSSLRTHIFTNKFKNTSTNIFIIEREFVFINFYYIYIFYQQSKTGFIFTVTHSTPVVVWIRCGFKKILKICLSTYNQCPSPKAKREIKRFCQLFSFSLRNPCIKSTSYKWKNNSVKREAQLVPIGKPIVETHLLKTWQICCHSIT